jgi:hypothetical protein
MTVIALPLADRSGTGAVPARGSAADVAGLVHDATAPLLSALEHAVRAAADRGTNDTGARRAADALCEARIVLDLAITRAGRVLADREILVHRAS